MKILKQGKESAAMGYSFDKRKRRRQHRRNAKDLSNQGSIFASVARWNLYQARYLGR